MLPFTLPDSPIYAVAFSGGADSRLLLELTLRALLERFGEAGRERVVAIHLHHGIRGDEADRDLAFCQRVCDEAGIQLVFHRADVPALAAQSGDSPETVARRERYTLFARVMSERHIPTLLTAHHADDNLETLLDRFLRGSGTRGMGGIPPSRSLRHAAESFPMTVCRPLLEWTRRDILTACETLGLDFVTDSTNLETDYTRNRIRHTVVPVLEAMAGEGIPQRAAARLSAAAREDDTCLTELAEEGAKVCRSPEGDGLGLEGLLNRHPAIAKRMMALLYEAVTAEDNPRDGSGTLQASHLEALVELIRKGIPESSVTLPRGMEARVRGEWLYIRPYRAFAPADPPPPTPLTEGATPWCDGITVTLERSPSLLPPLAGPDVLASAVFPPDLPLPLLARRRAEGDTILSHGMHKKLKKLLCDKGIPPHLRHRIPLICLSTGEPLWFPGAAFRDGYPTPAEGSCVRITIFAPPIIDFKK